MWLTERLASGGDEPLETGKIEHGSDADYLNAGRIIPLNKILSPFGYSAAPPDECEAAALRFQDGYILAGAVSSERLSPGEILIRSESGAFIKLLADGSVNINGFIISKNGETVGLQ